MADRVTEDVGGLRPLGELPGDVRTLTPNQVRALRAYPILFATNQFVQQVVVNRDQLSSNACVLVSRILLIAAEGIDQLWTTLVQTPVDTQIALASVALAAREVGKDLFRNALAATGALSAILPLVDLANLATIEAQDPEMAYAQSPIIDPGALTANLGATVAILADVRFN